jgi:hypothetical protein
MCPPVIGLILGAVGSIATAAMQAGIARQQAKIEQQQLMVEMENERIKGIGDTADRLEELRRASAQNRAALSASGLTENVSYTMGIAPYNAKVAASDVSRLEFNTGQILGRKKYEIAVAGWRAKTTAASAFIQAGANIAGDIGTYVARGSSGGYSRNSITAAS